eukprot:gene10219-13749_t
MADTLGNTKSKAQLLWYGVGYSAFSVLTINSTNLMISFINIYGQEVYNYDIAINNNNSTDDDNYSTTIENTNNTNSYNDDHNNTNNSSSSSVNQHSSLSDSSLFSFQKNIMKKKNYSPLTDDFDFDEKIDEESDLTDAILIQKNDVSEKTTHNIVHEINVDEFEQVNLPAWAFDDIYDYKDDISNNNNENNNYMEIENDDSITADLGPKTTSLPI